MNKIDLIRKIYEENNYTYQQIESIVNQVFDELGNAILENEKVMIYGFGTFERHLQKGYMGLNPSTGEKIFINDKYKIRFSISKNINKKKK